MSDLLIDVPSASRSRLLGPSIIALLVVAVTSGHWWIPPNEGQFHAAHILLRKLFLVPVILAAVWFNLRGALLTAAGATVLYLPHVALQWSGERAENLNQLGEIVTIWVTAGLTGVLAGREKSALVERAAAFHGTVRALVAALDVREHDTEQHSERVGAYSLRLADELGIDGRQRRALALGALLHDVGKIGVPDAILLKPSRLADSEWRKMREHPELGARILSSVPFLEGAVEIVHAHHERFDGSGYPRRLVGEDIPPEARIFAVADVYDELTSVRPYRRPISHSEASREIEDAAGTHFDSQVVEAFRQVPAEEWTRRETKSNLNT